MLPYASHYLAVPFEDLQRSPKLLNAIYFALSNLFGLKIERKHLLVKTGAAKRLQAQGYDEDYSKDFGKSPLPFGQPDQASPRMTLTGRLRTYGLRTLSYTLLLDRSRDYRAQGQFENALKCCKMRRVIKRLLNGNEVGVSWEEASTVVEIAKIALDNGEYKVAKEQAMRGLREMVRSNLHAEAIKFHCFLMHAFYGMSLRMRPTSTSARRWGPWTTTGGPSTHCIRHFMA
jgi:hypothetical protein